ncbi:metal-binding protein [Prochlorococcus marinus]|uniref:Metal-binding protein n=1 Tax=Prochlorococcus marinus (strain MIT 9211) TaxID=93059 RepID=A9BDD2_PROM4|nr:metal-binding protein [Prochlorococcus marinus]ABX09745.1 Hypothetical protein P9211_18141 [Prochlorococcus marinus str. MIT 9211]
MALGPKHDKSTKFWSLPFGIVIGITLGLQNGILAGISFALGGLWLSPDLDIDSKPLKRWGILKIMWWPYRKIIPHRSFFSHGPVIGTTLRVLYLMAIFTFMQLILKNLGIEPTSLSTENLIKSIYQYPKSALAIFLGIEGSAWLHLIQDKDPLPIKWKN